ncbi:MAG: TIGR02206 family membrane protein [Chthoniobacterales bacterium]|nr:TIGR02206 family membrane protein [Chthoniobacterales bacterium]
MPPLEGEGTFQHFSGQHLVVLFVTALLPFLLAALVWRSRSDRVPRAIVVVLSVILILNYVIYLAFTRSCGELPWTQMLPMQMCDWAMVVVMVTLWTRNHRWFEVAYFWGIGGTLQAVLTPNLHAGFPDLRFFNFFIAHSGIIVGVVFLILTARLRPYPMSIVRVLLWSEAYFVIAMIVVHLTGVNYGFLLHKPEAFSLLSYLSDDRPLYLLQMHGLALIFFAVLYAPWAIYDSLVAARGKLI